MFFSCFFFLDSTDHYENSYWWIIRIHYTRVNAFASCGFFCRVVREIALKFRGLHAEIYYSPSSQKKKKKILTSWLCRRKCVITSYAYYYIIYGRSVARSTDRDDERSPRRRYRGWLIGPSGPRSTHDRPVSADRWRSATARSIIALTLCDWRTSASPCPVGCNRPPRSTANHAA